MAVSVNPNRRPRSGTRLSVDSTDTPIGGRSGSTPPKDARPWSSANSGYAPRMNDNSFDRNGNSYLDVLNERYGDRESIPRSLDIMGNELLNFLGDEITGHANLSRSAYGMPLFDQYESPFNSFRRDPRRVDQYVRGDKRGRADGMANEGKRQALTAEEAKTLQDYLLEAEGMMGKGPNFDIIRQRYLQNANDSDARLQAMFKQLNSSYSANAAPIQASYDQAGAKIDQAGQQGVANVNAGYDAARNAQAEQFAALGIQDAAAVLGQDGEMAADQGMNAGGISRDAANYAGLNATNAQSAQQYNRGMQGAADLGGSESRALLQRSLMDNMAGLAFKESEYAPQRDSMKMSLAQQLQQAEQGGGMDAYQQAQMEQALAEFIAQQNQINYENVTGQQSNASNVFFKFLEMYDGNYDQAQQAWEQYRANGFN